MRGSPGDSCEVGVRFRLGVVMSIGTILLIVLVLILLGVLPTWPHARNWGYGPSGIVGVIVVIFDRVSVDGSAVVPLVPLRQLQATLELFSTSKNRLN